MTVRSAASLRDDATRAMNIFEQTYAAAVAPAKRRIDEGLEVAPSEDRAVGARSGR